MGRWFLAFIICVAVAGSTAVAQSVPIVITGVTVIPMNGHAPLADRTVVIENRHITAIRERGRVAIPRDAAVIDGTGNFLIPGLWDMHVHTTVPGGDVLLSLYVVNGVTGVRDMNDSFPLVKQWRSQIANGTLVGPRLVASGPYLEGGFVPIPHIAVRTPEAARAGVDSLARLGVDFVKIHNRLSRASYFAIADEVRKRHWVYAGHLPDSVTIVEAAEAGQRSLEHLFGFPSVCAESEAAALAPAHPIQRFLGACAATDPRESFRAVGRAGAWVTPTLVVNYPVATLPDTVFGSDSTNRYRSPALLRLQKMMMTMPRNVPPEAGIVGRRIFAKRVALVGILHQAGVALMTGTDAPGFNAFPGFSLHDELALFVDGGLTPLEALRTATVEPARYLGATDSLGTVEPGKLADLVLLDGNPLADIHNTRRIAAVIANGRLIDAKARRSLLEAAEAAARP